MECPRCAALRERQRRRFQERINNDPGFKAKVSERSKELYRKNPDRRRAAAYKRAIVNGTIPGNPVLMERYGIKPEDCQVSPAAQPAAPPERQDGQQ